MAVTASWLLTKRVLFVTPSQDYENSELEEIIQRIEYCCASFAPSEPLHVIHDLRAVDDILRVVGYAKTSCPQLRSINHQVIVSCDSFWTIEKAFLYYKLRNYAQVEIASSLDESFLRLRNADPTLPNLSTAFRAWLQDLVHAPFEKLALSNSHNPTDDNAL